MTTGRINQVAILGPVPHSQGEGRGRAPRGGPEFATRKGSGDPGGSHQAHEAARQGRAHPIAPTEFSKGPSVAGAIRPRGPSHSATWASQKEGTRPLPRPGGEREVGAFPRRSRLRVGHRPAVHRPRMVPTARREGRGGTSDP